jgi:amino acid adenylation domain-containing protein/thioester reductase-like protein
MEGAITRPGLAAEGGHRYSCAITPGLARRPAPADLLATAALAAVEATARLGARTAIRILTSAGLMELRPWSARVRRLQGPAARADLGKLITRTTSPAPNGCLVVSLDGAGLRGLTGYGLHLRCRVDGDTITVRARCGDADQWLRARGAAAELFAEVLGALLGDPLLPSALAPGIGAVSRNLVLAGFAGRAADDGEFRPVPALIEAQAVVRPDRPAVSSGSRRLSYRELDELSNGLAVTLAGRGVRRGDVVPVLLVNSLELPVAYLALMKLGAAFVPLDPAWPAGRIAAVLRVLAPRLVLCRAPAPGPVPSGLACVVDVDLIAATGRAPVVALGGEDVIYGIFTSGTTGVPKCAMNRQAGLANRFLFMSRYFGARGDEVVLQNSKHTFDSAVWQLFWPLTTGGQAVIPAQGEFLNLEHTIDTIAAHAITVTDFVPSIFNVLVSIVGSDPAALRKVSSLRHLIVGGEEMNPQMVHRLLGLLPGLRITNGYGPTEASIGMVFHPVSESDTEVVPLGRPIDNCHAIVVDDELHPLPPGASGEIAVGGVCVGAGYHREPGRTAEVFVPNPFPEIAGDRLYLTGDLGYYDRAGRLFFLGRKDLQVKIGGVRIELGEIEVAAENCPGVRHATVLVARRGDTKSLALFATGDGATTAAAVRGHLRRVLPRTSVPRHVLTLAAMPLTDNGKVDRHALADILDRKLARDAAALAAGPDGADGADGASGAALADQVLRVLQRALGSADLGPATSFMDAGGDSIRALSAVAALSAECGVEVGVQDLFDNPTATGLAGLIELRREGGAEIEAELALMERDAIGPARPPARPLAGPARPPARPLAPAAEPHVVLVTGATGFVGSRLVHELLATTAMRVICLARAGDDADALARVTDALVRRGLWQPSFAARLGAHAGDLAQPRLGLAGTTWQDLACGCDLVLHCGALVNFLFDYRTHRAANVGGTAELLRLAVEHRAKPFHHISTLGVLSGEAERRANQAAQVRGPGMAPGGAGAGPPCPDGPDGRLAEDVDIGSARAPASGYTRSKWVAERYLAAARRAGVLVTTLRLGEVMPSGDNGYPNTRALTHLLLSSFLRLGACPDVPIRSDFTPVDYVATRVVAAVRDRAAWGQTMHVFHPQAVSFTGLLDGGGAAVKRIGCGEFLARLDDAARGDPVLATLAALLPIRAQRGEAALRAMFGGLLSDNPGLYRKDACRWLESRWQLADNVLDAPVHAYLAYLSRALPAHPRPAAIGR